MRKVALVTGGAKRIGKAIATRLALEGYELILHYYSSGELARQTRDELLSLGAPAVHLVSADLSLPEGRRSLLSTALAQAGHLSLMVCSAATFEYDQAHTASPEALATHMQTNFFAPVELITAWAQLQGRLFQGVPAHAVVLLDQKLDNLNPDFFSYTLSKLALGASVRFLAQTCAPVLRVNAVSPGVTLTSGDMSPTEFHAAHKVAALGKSSTPGDIADAVWCLESLSAVTGQTLAVDGGQHPVPRRRDVAFPETP